MNKSKRKSNSLIKANQQTCMSTSENNKTSINANISEFDQSGHFLQRTYTEKSEAIENVGEEMASNSIINQILSNCST